MTDVNKNEKGVASDFLDAGKEKFKAGLDAGKNYVTKKFHGGVDALVGIFDNVKGKASDGLDKGLDKAKEYFVSIIEPAMDGLIKFFSDKAKKVGSLLDSVFDWFGNSDGKYAKAFASSIHDIGVDIKEYILDDEGNEMAQTPANKAGGMKLQPANKAANREGVLYKWRQ